MSYLSGFMMGAAIGKGVRQFIAGDGNNAHIAAKTPPTFALAAKSAGRRRYRIAHLSHVLAALLTEKLTKLPYVKTAEANPATGSLLILFNPKDETKIDALAAALAQRVFAAPLRQNLPAKQSLRSLPNDATNNESGSITLSIRRSMHDFSAFITRNTGGLFDAKSLAATLLLLRGLRKMILTKQYPSGSAMLWWAVSLMRGWRAI